MDLTHGVYSQQDEQHAICRWFDELGPPAKKPRRFLDVGAWTGIVFSNTYALSLRGWAGVCIEPSPLPFAKLMRAYRTNPRVALVNAAVDVEPGLVAFHVTEDAVSSMNDAHRDIWIKNYSVPFQTVWVCRITMKHVLRAFPGGFDFVSIDVEGGSWHLLRSIDWALLGATLICVEHDGAVDEIKRTADEYGFDVVHTTQENILLGKRRA